VDFFRAPRGRAAAARAARARMFVTSRVPFHPTQQYKIKNLRVRVVCFYYSEGAAAFPLIIIYCALN
jgi:hypothetical protein